MRHTFSLYVLRTQALGEVIKAITALPSDQTIVTLPPAPLLELVAASLRRNVTGVWLGLAGMLIGQLNPPSTTTGVLKTFPTPETRSFVARVLPSLVDPVMRVLNSPAALASEPDVAQAFFRFLEQTARNFVWAFFELSTPTFNAAMQCAIGALGLQEKYSLVAACNFLVRGA